MPQSHEKCIISCALTGATTMRSANPSVPYTKDEFIAEAVKCYEHGATIVHIHARDPETGAPTADHDILGGIVEGIMEACPIVINLSTAISTTATPEERISVVQKFKPEMASLNTNSMNFAAGNYKTHTIIGETIFANTFHQLEWYAKEMLKVGTKPELEVYDLSGFYNVDFLAQREGLFKEPLHFQYIMGVLGGAKYSLRNLVLFHETAPANSTWSVGGVGQAEWPCVFHAASTGGHVRVGLEDNVWLRKGQLAKGSWESVAKAAEIIKLADRPIARVEETREMLGLKGR